MTELGSEAGLTVADMVSSVSICSHREEGDLVSGQWQLHSSARSRITSALSRSLPALQLLTPRVWGLGSLGPKPGQDRGRDSMGSRVTQRWMWKVPVPSSLAVSQGRLLNPSHPRQAAL